MLLTDQFRADCREYALRWFPERHAEIELGDELLAFVANRENQNTHLTNGRFWMQHVVLMGDSVGSARILKEDADLICGPVYLRISILSGVPPARSGCVHYLACVRGRVVGILPSHGHLTLVVDAGQYIITETF